MPSRTCRSTLCRTTRRLKAVRPAVITTMESKKRVRSRVRGTSVLPEFPGKAGETDSDEGAKGLSANELITHSMYRAEMHWTGRVALQFLAQFKDMVIYGA